MPSDSASVGKRGYFLAWVTVDPRGAIEVLQVSEHPTSRHPIPQSTVEHVVDEDGERVLIRCGGETEVDALRSARLAAIAVASHVAQGAELLLALGCIVSSRS